MSKIEQIANSLGITDDQYSYKTNDLGEVISLEIFEPEYDYSLSFIKIHLLKFVSSFKHLELLEIALSDFLIENLHEISDLKYLKTLHIECDTEVKNLNFLTQMKDLEHLYLQSSQIADLNGIEKHSKLTHLFLGDSKIKNLNPLKELIGLDQLGIFHNQIEDISVLKYLKNLKVLYLQHNNIEDISVFSEFKTIRHLDLSFNEIKNIDSVKENVDILYLNINNNEVDDISVVKNFQKIRDLSLANNKIEDISALENVELLEHLNISGNKIKEIAPIKNHRNLKIFYTGNNPLEDIGKIEFASQFTYLHLENSGLKDISFLLNQHKIVHLILNNNSIRHFSSLEGKNNLKEIYLKSNNNSENFPIHYFSDLEKIDLTGNPFGNQMFSRYGGQDLNGQKIGLMSDLAKLNADYYYNKGMMDEALAYFYYENKDSNKYPEVFHIYLQKILGTASSEVVYIKYYFSIVTNFLRFYDNLDFLTEENYNHIYSKIDSVQEPERSSMLEILYKLRQKKRVAFNFNYYDFHFYEEKISNPFISDELLFIKGSISVKRDQLMTNLYYLKLLKKRSSPFYFTLLHKIENVLKMNFAYTEEERKEHDYYRSLIQNLDESNIPKNKVYFSNSYFDKHYQYAHFDHPESSDKKKENGKGSNAILCTIAIITLFAICMAVKSCLNLF
ncbi:Leucine-rich repeat (LRR) protein [Chryseobacterium arachidis]|uniref:Leucine-rich repeat (LRR) protein n=1 Tax=Chryseobacterium arachidis TaxID=1416778 RepID=A0A1M4X635_9FLAO|nr:leucine-rich repeat domain-containing protein [Chryseobacterium arachidis]SHE88843.1 Leucine-rich repeat (LRR) protein [Chryseobacterium arachidis]